MSGFKTRLEALGRQLVDSGDLTPTGQRMLQVVLDEQLRACDFSGMSIAQCQDSICDCFTEGTEDGSGGMGPQVSTQW